MKRPGLPVLVLVAAAVLVAGGLALLRTSPRARLEAEREARKAAAPAATSSAAAPAAALAVGSYRVKPANGGRLVDVAATLEPARKVMIGAEVGGSVVEVLADEHGSVEAGALLVRLDPALPNAAVERARAGLARAQAAARLARSELRRQRDLSERGVASPAELDRAESEERTRAAQVAEARAELRDAETRLDKTRIVAPFAGVVSQLDLEPGAYLNPGSPVAEIVDLSEIEIEVGLGDRQVLALRDGDVVRVAVDVFPGEWFEGRVQRVGRSPDPETRRFPVPIRVPNTDARLLPGMLGTVRFDLARSGTASGLEVPRAALRREFDLDYVFVLESNGASGQATARRRRVATQPLPFRPDLVSVTEGLEAGERIAVSGVRELRDGLRVGVVEDGQQ